MSLLLAWWCRRRLHDQDLWRSLEERCVPVYFCVRSKNVARKVLQSLEALKMVGKDPNGGRRLTPQGTRDLDRIAGQVAAASKKS